MAQYGNAGNMKSFGSFRLDPANQCLWRGEKRVPLTPKAFDVLRYLVDHPGRLVAQDEILEALWPETYVNPELIKKYILAIRKALGDRHDKPEFIETFPKRGYQFVATVSYDVVPGSRDLAAGTTKKLVGRDGTLAELHNSLGRVLRGQRQVVFVTGEAGIGKTALVDVFHQQAVRNHTLRVARGQCVEGFGGKEAYYPMLESLGQLTRNPDGNAVIQTIAKCAPTWLIQFPSLVEAEHREALQREILGATRERMVREICEALEANGNEPWLFNFREAWLRTLVFDFDGARRLCDLIMRPDAEYPTGQPRTIARVAAGYAELDRAHHDQRSNTSRKFATRR